MGQRTMIRGLQRLRESRLALPTVLLLLGGISYGSLFTANKIAIDAGFPFIAYSFWQALFASAVLLALSAIFSKLPSLRRENLRVFALVAVFGFLGPLLVVTYVADRLPPAVLTLCAALIPAATYALTLVLRLDRLRWLSVAGVLLGFGGILLIVVPTGSLPEAGAWVWVLFSLLMPLSAAVNNVAGARFSPVGVSALALAGGMMLVSALVLLLVMLAEGESVSCRPTRRPPASGACSGPRPARRSPTAASSRSCAVPALSSSRSSTMWWWRPVFSGRASSSARRSATGSGPRSRCWW